MHSIKTELSLPELVRSRCKQSCCCFLDIWRNFKGVLGIISQEVGSRKALESRKDHTTLLKPSCYANEDTRAFTLECCLSLKITLSSP